MDKRYALFIMLFTASMAIGKTSHLKQYEKYFPETDINKLVDDGFWNTKMSAVPFLYKRGQLAQRAELLFRAAEVGDVETIQQLQKGTIHFTYRDKKGNNALHIAAQNGHEDVLLLLCRSHLLKKPGWFNDSQGYTTVDEKNNNNETALHVASQHKKDSVANMLLQKGFSPTARNKDNRVPLHIAALNGNIKSASVLLLANQSSKDTTDANGSTPLHLAVDNKQLGTTSLLLQHDVHVDTKDADGNTSLLLACKTGNKALISLLIQKGANQNETNHKGETASAILARSGHSSLIDLLDPATARKNMLATDNNGNTMLHIAAEIVAKKEDEQLLSAILCDHKLLAELIKQKNNNGHNALTDAVMCGNIKAAKAFTDNSYISARIPELTDNNRQNALHVALCHNQTDIAVELVKHRRALLYLHKDQSGNVPLVYAILQNNNSIIDDFMYHRPPSSEFQRIMGTKNNAGETIVHFAVQKNISSIINELRSDTLKTKNNKGQTPIHYAAKATDPIKVLELLQSRLQNYFSQAVCKADYDKKTLLHMLVQADKPDACKWVIEHGGKITVNSHDSSEWTPAHYAFDKHPDLVHFMYRNGLQVEPIRTPHGDNYLHCAIKSRHPELVRLFAQHSNLIDDTNNNNETPLLLACTLNREDAARILLEQYLLHEVDPQETAFMHATEKGYTSIANMFLRKQEFVPKDQLQRAVQQYKTKTALYLLDHDRRINPRSHLDRSLHTVMHIAAEYGHAELFETLMSRGENIMPKNIIGKTPYDIVTHVAYPHVGHQKIHKLCKQVLTECDNIQKARDEITQSLSQEIAVLLQQNPNSYYQQKYRQIMTQLSTQQSLETATTLSPEQRSKMLNDLNTLRQKIRDIKSELTRQLNNKTQQECTEIVRVQTAITELYKNNQNLIKKIKELAPEEELDAITSLPAGKDIGTLSRWTSSERKSTLHNFIKIQNDANALKTTLEQRLKQIEQEKEKARNVQQQKPQEISQEAFVESTHTCGICYDAESATTNVTCRDNKHNASFVCESCRPSIPTGKPACLLCWHS